MHKCKKRSFESNKCKKRNRDRDRLSVKKDLWMLEPVGKWVPEMWLFSSVSEKLMP